MKKQIHVSVSVSKVNDKMLPILFTQMEDITEGRLTISTNKALTSLINPIIARMGLDNKLFEKGIYKPYPASFASKQGGLSKECLQILNDRDVKKAIELGKKVREENKKIKEHLKS